MDSQTDSLPTTDLTAELKQEIAEKQSLLDSLKERMQGNRLHPDDTKFLLDLMNRDDHDHWDRSKPKPRNYKVMKKRAKKMGRDSQRRNRCG